jgi:hypothetical protein
MANNSVSASGVELEMFKMPGENVVYYISRLKEIVSITEHPEKGVNITLADGNVQQINETVETAKRKIDEVISLREKIAAGWANDKPNL